MRVFLVLAAALIVAGCSGPSDATPAPSSSAPVIQPGTPGGPNQTLSSVPSTTPTVDPDDTAFLRDMMIHHSQAIQMSAWAPSRAADKSVRGLAERIRVGQQPEIDAMATMLRGWGQPVPDLAHAQHLDHSGMPGMASPAQLAALSKASGKTFDKMFLELMIRHHQGAVTMSKTEAAGGRDLRTLEMAQEIGVTQTKEILVMRKLLGSL